MPRKKASLPPEQLQEKISAFLRAAAAPAAIEAGQLPFLLDPEHFQLSVTPQGLLFEVWDQDRNLARRIVGVLSESARKLDLDTLRFGGRTGRLTITDLDGQRAQETIRTAARDVVREQLRVMAARQFPGWQVPEVTSGASLQHTLSPAFARGMVRRGEFRWAILAAPDTAAASSALTHGLIWLDYLRQRERPHAMEGLALFLPASEVAATRIRLACLHRQGVRYRLFSYDERGIERQEDLDDLGNLDTSVEPAPARSLADDTSLPAWTRQLADLPEVEVLPVAAGHWSLRIRGLEFASVRQGEVWAGIGKPARVRRAEPVERLAQELARIRCVDSADPMHEWRLARPEAWMESLVRGQLSLIDPALNPERVYGQVPNFGGRDRGIIDLLAIGRDGRLCVIELKASEDPGLPVQALDYWWRVARHAERGDFQQRGYFAGAAVAPLPPRLLLVAPALSFHPTTETILAAFAPDLEVERVGLDVEWQARPRVVLRVRGALRPEWNSAV